MSKNPTHDGDLDGLPQLTDKQYNFVAAKAKGMTDADAYRTAYPTDKMQIQTVWRRAAEVSSNSKVQAWLEHARREATSRLVDETKYTLEAHLAELDALMKQAADKGSYGSAVQASISKGRACNHYTEHKSVTVSNESDLAMISKLEKLLGEDIAGEALSRLGYTEKRLDS